MQNGGGMRGTMGFCGRYSMAIIGRPGTMTACAFGVGTRVQREPSRLCCLRDFCQGDQGLASDELFGGISDVQTKLARAAIWRRFMNASPCAVPARLYRARRKTAACAGNPKPQRKPPKPAGQHRPRGPNQTSANPDAKAYWDGSLDFRNWGPL